MPNTLPVPEQCSQNGQTISTAHRLAGMDSGISSVSAQFRRRPLSPVGSGRPSCVWPSAIFSILASLASSVEDRVRVRSPGQLSRRGSNAKNDCRVFRTGIILSGAAQIRAAIAKMKIDGPRARPETKATSDPLERKMPRMKTVTNCGNQMSGKRFQQRVHLCSVVDALAEFERE